ncbi:hypothetical protein, partial [Pseudomonas sp. AH2 (2023)]|uniref:hypothetical protein n=1 Tax=Pseudomonas sp. AH2 (2023) TaxID=3048599 RepID=UPI002B23CC0F
WLANEGDVSGATESSHSQASLLPQVFWGLAEQYLKPVKAGLPTKAMCQAPLSQAIRRQACSHRFGAWLSNIQLVGVGLPTKAIVRRH